MTKSTTPRGGGFNRWLWRPIQSRLPRGHDEVGGDEDNGSAHREHTTFRVLAIPGSNSQRIEPQYSAELDVGAQVTGKGKENDRRASSNLTNRIWFIACR